MHFDIDITSLLSVVILGSLHNAEQSESCTVYEKSIQYNGHKTNTYVWTLTAAP